jgi:hypothetical protein
MAAPLCSGATVLQGADGKPIGFTDDRRECASDRLLL